MGFVRIWLGLLILLLLAYGVLWVASRLAERRRLARLWEEEGTGDRGAFVAAGMAAWGRSPGRRLLWLVVVGPMAALAVLLYLLNVQ